jgi:hypothetical protein
LSFKREMLPLVRGYLVAVFKRLVEMVTVSATAAALLSEQVRRTLLEEVALQPFKQDLEARLVMSSSLAAVVLAALPLWVVMFVSLAVSVSVAVTVAMFVLLVALLRGPPDSLVSILRPTVMVAATSSASPP